MTASTLTADNGASSGTSGIKYNGGTDGTLQLQTTTSGGTATTAVTIDNSQNTTLAGYLNAPNTFGFKNRIINGAMAISQRGTSFTPALYDYTIDRWQTQVTQSGKYTLAQSSTAPTGFGFSMLITSSSAYSISSTDCFDEKQYIEGFNCYDFSWGTASAVTVTLSFWVRSSLTGTFGGAVQNAAGNRSYPFSYTINSANTFEYKTITIPGDTTGTWMSANNSVGLALVFGLGVGSTLSNTAGSWAAGDYRSATGATSVVGTNGATFYITGVQLEKGSTATSFDYRPYGTELQLCQRYFNTVKAISGGSGSSTTNFYANVQYPEMRATPTYAVTGAIVATDPGVAAYTQSAAAVTVAGGSSPNGAFLYFPNFSGMSAQHVIMLNGLTTYLTLSAEL